MYNCHFCKLPLVKVKAFSFLHSKYECYACSFSVCFLEKELAWLAFVTPDGLHCFSGTWSDKKHSIIYARIKDRYETILEIPETFSLEKIEDLLDIVNKCNRLLMFV